MASGMKVIVKGEREGKQVTYTSDIVGRTAPGTGIAASIAALMLHSGDIKVKGVVAPEGCIDPGKYFAALLKRGAKIHQTETIRSMLTL
jgi:saccharopine dehydrogenase (NAD+, L-lysine-forming)